MLTFTIAETIIIPAGITGVMVVRKGHAFLGRNKIEVLQRNLGFEDLTWSCGTIYTRFRLDSSQWFYQKVVKNRRIGKRRELQMETVCALHILLNQSAISRKRC